MVDTAAREHSVVLNLRATDGWAVGSNEDKLSLSLTKSLQGRLVAEVVLARLHHQSQARVNGLRGLLL